MKSRKTLEINGSDQRRSISSGNRFLSFFKIYTKSLIVTLTPIFLLPIILLNDTAQYRCLFVVCLMTIFWCSEALPLPITSMLPVVLFPLMGILDTSITCMMYMTDTMFMFIGGLVIALSIEYCNLHKRVALKIISIIGCSQRRLNFGLLAVTMFISMWISNTAAVAMMCPIMQAVLEELESQGLCKMYLDNDTGENEEGAKKEEEERKPSAVADRRPAKITICYFMGTTYAATFGGCGTLVGSPVNMAFKGIYEAQFSQFEIDFPRYMLFNIPVMLINTLVMWTYLQWLYMGLFRPNSKEAKESQMGEEGQKIAKQVIIRKYNELGPITTHEISVAFLFVLSILLFFFRDPGFIPGWASFSKKTKIGDATPAVLIIVLLFLLPQNFEWINYLGSKSKNVPINATSSLITWKFINQKLSWGLIFLLGGGFALSRGGKETGMSAMLAQSLSSLNTLPILVVLFMVCLFAQCFTEFASNVAVTNVILPVLAEISKQLGIHPLFLMMPAALSCSMAFHTPVGTPPNAIAASAGNIKTKDIALSGIGSTLISLLSIWVAMPTLGVLIYPEINSFTGFPTDTTQIANITTH